MSTSGSLTENRIENMHNLSEKESAHANSMLCMVTLKLCTFPRSRIWAYAKLSTEVPPKWG
jgi:hypothetical protein